MPPPEGRLPYPPLTREPQPQARRAEVKDQQGFALLAVMLVLSLLGVIGAEFAFSMRLEASMVRAYKDGVAGGHLAEAAVHQAIREVLADAQIQALDEDGVLRLYRTAIGSPAPTKVPPLPREKVPLAPGEFSYRITDEEARVNLNAPNPDRFERLLVALGVERRAREIIADSLQDWRDPNEEHRINGAESDHYLKLPVPYRSRNGNLLDAAELLQIRGVTSEIYWGKPDKPGLAEYVTTFGRGVINMNTAPAPVLKALNLSDAEITDIVQTRTRAPYPFVPGRYAGRGLAVGSQTFRIEAQGIVGGEPRARLIVVVQRSQPRPGPAVVLPGATPPPATGVTFLSWRQGQEG